MAFAIAAGCRGSAEPDQQRPAAGPKAAAPAAPVSAPSILERGEYLVKAANCGVCHTAAGPQGPDIEHAFAGGLEVKEIFGTWRSTNITPDRATGIGAWTDEQIVRAIREGVRPDGSHLAAIMPSNNFSVFSDGDARAIVAFLRALPPIERKIERTGPDFKMPPVPLPVFATRPAPEGDPVARGAYLATVMQCSHCHWTPDKTGAPLGPDHMFSGGLPMEFPPGDGTVYARNLTSDAATGIGGWTEDQIASTIRTMVKPSGERIRGPMLILQGGWSTLSDRDLHALAAFIKSLPPVNHAVPVAAPPQKPS